MNLIERMEATQKTVDMFRCKDFAPGKFDCVQMWLAQRRHAGLKKIRIPPYGDWESAAKSMRAMGVSSLSEGLDKYHPRIDPHNVLMGDFIEGPGSNGFSALMLVVGNGRVLGFHEDISFAEILQPLMISAAWTLEPYGKQRLVADHV
jgi:hypothetical protein